jgi:hypothetical protein
MELFRRLQLQVLLISTVEKSTAIQPYCDITYSIVRHGDANAITARRNLLPCFLRNGEKQGIFLVILALPPGRESC